jgi:hypothetical protein
VKRPTIILAPKSIGKAILIHTHLAGGRPYIILCPDEHTARRWRAAGAETRVVPPRKS